MKTSIYKSQEGKELILEAYAEILKNWPIPYEKHMVQTSFGKTHVMTCGNPNLPPLVLIHGSSSNNFCWIGDIKTYTENHYVYLIDMIGEANYSDDNRPKYASGAYEPWLNELMEHFHLKKADFIGLSLGGWMALSFASKFPTKVNHMVLISMGGLAPTKISFLIKLICFNLFSKKSDEKIMKLLNGGKLPDRDEPGLMKALEFTTLINKHFKPRMEPLPLFDKKQLETVHAPVLIFYGEKDALLHPEKSIQFLKENCKNSQGILLENTGHVVTGITKEITTFLNGENYETTSL